MSTRYLFHFDSNLSKTKIPEKLNNPFDVEVPEIAQIAAEEFQVFLAKEAQKWQPDLLAKKGKMFGVMVVQKIDLTYAFIGTVSGKLPENTHCEKFIPSVFDDSTDDFFINKGMVELTELGNQIKVATTPLEVKSLKDSRKQKSFALQQQLFENYRFLNTSGETQNVLQIFEESSHGNPPSAAGECAAPKLLHFAFQHQLKPIAIAEFWWGGAMANNERQHLGFYPACKNKCRPILEFMLEDKTLFVD
jgi:tRNA pseudouridine32 synthase/23S rRNA pseudouridine746 synthase